MKTSPEPKKILVFRPGHLGDTLVALPALWSLRFAFPSAELTLLYNVNNRNPQYLTPKDVLPASGLIDRWLPYDYYDEQGSFEKLSSRLKLFFQLRRGRFDTVAYLLQRDRSVRQFDRDRRFFELVGVRYFIGLSGLRSGSFELNPAPARKRVSSEGEFLLECLASDGVPKKVPNKDLLLLTDEERNIAAGFRDKFFIDVKKRRLAAVAPGGKRPSRIWNKARYVEVIEKLVLENNVFPIFFGSSGERQLGQEILDAVGNGLNLAGDLGVRESAAVLELCGFYLGNDTGTMHLAGAVGLRCVALFSAADRNGQWEPFGSSHIFFRRHVECEGCRIDICDRGNLCLELIEADEVYDACVRMINSEVEIQRGKTREFVR